MADLKLLKQIQEALKPKKVTEPYDTTATVRRVENGVAWVHIPGGVDETPVELTINAQEGDAVRVRVSGGQAWIAGNNTSPPTDDSTARTLAKEVNTEVTKKVTDLDYSLNQDEIFKRITNNGMWQGIYLDEATGNYYFNATYIHAGTLTLGGANNASGVLRLYDQSNTEIGNWTKDGLVATTGSIGTWDMFATGLFAQHTIAKETRGTVTVYDPEYAYDSDGEPVYLTVESPTPASGNVQTTYGRGGGSISAYASIAYTAVETEYGDNETETYYPLKNGERIQDITAVGSHQEDTSDVIVTQDDAYSGLFSRGEIGLAISMSIDPSLLPANPTDANVNAVSGTGLLRLYNNGRAVVQRIHVLGGTGLSYGSPGITLDRMRSTGKTTRVYLYTADSDAAQLGFQFNSDATGSGTTTYFGYMDANSFYPYSTGLRYLGLSNHRWLILYSKQADLSGNLVVGGTSTLKGAVKSTGDFTSRKQMASVWLISTDIDSKIGKTIPSDNRRTDGIHGYDKTDYMCFYSQTVKTPNDDFYRSFVVRRKNASNTEISNGFYLHVNASGNATVTWAGEGKTAWTNAQGLNSSVRGVTADNVSVATATDKTLCNTGSLAAGTYIIKFQGSFPNNATGIRNVHLSTSNNGTAVDRHASAEVPAGSRQLNVTGTYLTTITSATTFYLVAYQTSGSTLSVSGGIEILKIHD